MEVQDPKAGEAPLAELTSIQFGVLNKEDTITFSVFEKHHFINTARDLWDGRLGIYNLPGNNNHCTTCGARKASDCDGHFGHITLPMPVYHPLHIRFLKNVLSRICLVCRRLKEKKEVKKGTFEEKATWLEIKRQLENAESPDSESDTEIAVAKKSCSLKAKFNIEDLSAEEFFKSPWAQVAEILASGPRSLATEVRSTHVVAHIGSKNSVLPSLIESSDDDSPKFGATQRPSKKPDHLQPEVKIFTNSKISRDLVEELDSSESSDDEEGCKYCGAKIKKAEDRYPNLVVTLSKKMDNSYETIEMRACMKEDKVPLDYWTFVHGHPGGCDKNIRPLLPFEALVILRSLSEKVIRKLGMDERIARPEALILSTLPVPPSGSRITEVDVGSSLPRTHTDKQHMHLQRLSSEVKRLQSSRIGKPKFAAVQNEVMELQILASDYLTGSKWENGLKYKAYNPVKRDVEKDDKLMKSILAKTNNSSARMIVVGDPSIKIEEILLPVFLVEQLTIPEKVSTFNINRLQQYVDNGPYADLYRTGAVHIDKPGEGRIRLQSRRPKMALEIEIGDTVHRHIKDGDLVIVNRPPSLTKHSIMAMEVRLHRGCSSAINPLICASFQADFDGDCMHIFVPQSPESLAELHGLMRVSDQLINPQGGQSNNVLAEDSRLGAYLINSPCLFLNKTEMSQLTSSSLSSLPVPAILKSPKVNEPLWTGQQLYSTILPKGICYRAADKKFSTDVKRGILIRDGELLVCDGNSNWLGNAPDALTAVISEIQGPAAALAYLNRAQELANMYIRDRGFSVGLQDFQLTRNRSQLLRRRLEEVNRGNREALMQTLLEDQNVQREELKKNPTSQRGLSVGTECSKSKGLFLGTTGIAKRSEALDKVAINRFQKKFGQTTDRLARDYCKKFNPLLVMIKAGSKGSMSKLVQQTISLGLQLYKGEHLLPWSVQDLLYQRELTDTSSSRAIDLLQFEKGAPLVNLSGYWESRGIITSSYLDGLSPLQFFTHSISSRYGMLRAKVEEPNILLKKLLLFLRNLHVGYDGSVRSLEGQQIVQFEYGGLLELDGQGSALKAVKGPTDRCEAGEAVGILAATAITEPAYQLKLDSPHNVGAKAIGPLDLIKETLSSRKAITLVDRRVLLRMPLALRNRRHGQEKGATRIEQHLKPVTLDMVTSTTMIEYRKTQTEVGEHGRKSPWVGHIRLNVEKLNVHQVFVKELLTRLENKHSTCKFSSSNRCRFGSSPSSQEEPESCIHFFTDIPSSTAAFDDKEYDEHMSCLLEATKDTLLPNLLCTVLKGDERIQSVTLLWEDMDWNPRCSKNPLRNSCKHESGEVVVEVTVKKNYCKIRGKAWEIAKEACLPIMQLLDWQRCTPYSIKELNHVFGLEAAKGVLLQRLELAVAGMGKGVNLEHLELIADSMVTSGEVNGATLSGYKDLCKTISRSAPFSVAAFQNPKNSFVSVGRHGACETIEGALSSSVWGKAPSLGTGSSFGVLWQAKAGEEPALKIQQGVDIHECIAKLNSLAPTGSCTADSVPQCPNVPQSRPTRGKFIYRIQQQSRHKDSYPHDVCDTDGRRLTRGGLRMANSGDRRSQQLSRQVASAVPSAPSKVPSQPKMARAEATNGDEGSLVNYDLKRGSKHSHRGRIERNAKLFFKDSTARTVKASSHTLQASRGRSNATKAQGTGNQDLVMSHAGLDRASDDGSNSHPPLTLPISSEKLALVNSRTEAPEDSSSFHTPNETLETHSANSSPCSSFRKVLHLSNFPESNTSEGDQMSGISQPPLGTLAPIDEFLGTVSCATTQRAKGAKGERQGLEGCGSMSPIEERSSRKVSGQHSNFTIETSSRLNASEDALERRKKELNDEWERLRTFHRAVNFILHRKYEVGQRLKERDQKMIMENVLRFHPDYAQKVGCGVHHIKVDYHQSYSSSRCFFVVRLDKSICDFSYRKCIKSLANAKSPALAMRYDHEVLIKYERDNCSDDIDQLDSFDFDPPYLIAPWSSLPKHNQLGSDLTLPEMMKPNDGDCDESKLSDFKPKEESSCETSELEPEL